MSSWKLNVTSRFRAPLDQVWRLKTDPVSLADELLPYLQLAVDDVEGLQRALRHEGGRTFPGRVAGPLGLLWAPWPFEIREVEPPLRYRDTSTNMLYSAFEHRHVLEPEGEVVRYTDEVRFTPRLRPSRLTAQITAQLFRHRHARAARHLPTAGEIGLTRLERAP